MNLIQNISLCKTQNTIEDEMFNFIYLFAMRDATMRGAFKGEKKWVFKVVGAKSAAKSYVDNVLNGSFTDKANHDKVYLDTARKVCDEINGYENKPIDSRIFTFGNAQKLINMTAKYYYATTYSNPDERVKFAYCHCPMDSIMLKKVWDNFFHTTPFQIGINVNELRRQKLGGRTNFLASWGNEDFLHSDQYPERYLRFQNIIMEWSERAHCTPLEFDYYLWQGDDVIEELTD